MTIRNDVRYLRQILDHRLRRPVDPTLQEGTWVYTVLPSLQRDGRVETLADLTRWRALFTALFHFYYTHDHRSAVQKYSFIYSRHGHYGGHPQSPSLEYSDRPYPFASWSQAAYLQLVDAWHPTTPWWRQRLWWLVSRCDLPNPYHYTVSRDGPGSWPP